MADDAKLIQNKLRHLELIMIFQGWPLFIGSFHVGHPDLPGKVKWPLINRRGNKTS
jgi:hypothetical protein